MFKQHGIFGRQNNSLKSKKKKVASDVLSAKQYS
jgi:hypothetical protein